MILLASTRAMCTTKKKKSRKLRVLPDNVRPGGHALRTFLSEPTTDALAREKFSPPCRVSARASSAIRCLCSLAD